MADTAYATPEAAVAALRPGWKIVGKQLYEVEGPNPARTVPGPDGKIDPLAPATIKQPKGTILSIEGPNGEPDTMTVSTPGPLPNETIGGAKGGVGLTILSGPTKGPSATTNKPSDPTKWIPVPRDPTQPASGTNQVGTWDPVNAEFHATAAPPGATKTGVLVPAVITETAADGTQTRRQIGVIDQGDNSLTPLSDKPAKPSGVYEDQFVTDANGKKRIVGKTDTGDKSFHPVAGDSTTGLTTIQTPTGVYQVNTDGELTNGGKPIITIDKNVPFQAVNIDGTVYRFDPNEKDPTKALVKVSPDAPMPKTIKQGETTWILTDQPDGTQKYELPPGVSKTLTLVTNTTAKTLEYRDPDTGALVKSEPNENYVAPKVDNATLPAPNAVADKILVGDPDHPGKTMWIPNEGKVTASAALQQLASSLSGHVVDGKISVDEAKTIIDGANTAMQNATTAASNTLTGVNNAAQIGGNLLQNRVSAATGAFNTAVNAIAGSKMTSAPAGLGADLVGGLSEWVTGLGGGQPVYDAAAAMVNQANPALKGADPSYVQQAYAMLRGAMDLYKTKTGQDYVPPDQRGGMTAPAATPNVVSGTALGQQTNAPVSNPAAVAANQTNAQGFNPQLSTAALNAQGLQDTPQGRAVAAGQTPVASVPPTYPGQMNLAYNQAVRPITGTPATGNIAGPIYGPGGNVPMLPIPQGPWYPGAQQFVAPAMA